MILLEENIQAIKNHRRMCFKGTYQLKKKEMKKTFKLISNLWMRLSMIFWISKSEIWVVFWSQRTREITRTHTKGLIYRDFMRKPNSIIFLLRRFFKIWACERFKTLHGIGKKKLSKFWTRNDSCNISYGYWVIVSSAHAIKYLLVTINPSDIL